MDMRPVDHKQARINLQRLERQHQWNSLLFGAMFGVFIFTLALGFRLAAPTVLSSLGFLSAYGFMKTRKGL